MQKIDLIYVQFMKDLTLFLCVCNQMNVSAILGFFSQVVFENSPK